MSFGQAVKNWVRKSNDNAILGLKLAAQTLVDEVSTPTAKGGKMPVDTGFLRNSVRGSIGGIPSGPSDPRTDKQEPFGEVYLAINQWNTLEDLYIGWTAVYAPYMEAYYGFFEAGAQRWQQIVDESMKKVTR